MTNGTAAAMILTDSILGRRNRWAPLYDSKRPVHRSALGSFFKENVTAGLHFVRDPFSRTDRRSVAELKPGEGP